MCASGAVNTDMFCVEVFMLPEEEEKNIRFSLFILCVCVCVCVCVRACVRACV